MSVNSILPLLSKNYVKIAKLLACSLIMLALVSCEGGGGGIADGHDFGDNDPNLYVAFGDSITEGYGLDNYYECYPVRLAGMLGKTVANEGVGGNRSAEGFARVDRVLRSYKPGYLLILFGSNDLIHRWSQTYTIANLRAIIQAAKNNKTIPVIATVPPACKGYQFIAGDVVSLNILIREMADEEDVHVVDLEKELNGKPELFSDGLHPNAEGHAIIAAAFNDVLR